MKIIQLIVFLAISGKIAARLRRSVGGHPISIEYAPYYVSIQRNNEHVCGGALVTEKHVVTATSCLVNRDNLTVVSGTDDNNSVRTCSSIADIQVHDPIVIANDGNPWPDLAVITLLESLILSDQQNATSLPNAEPVNHATAALVAFRTVDHPFQPVDLQLFHTLMMQSHSCPPAKDIRMIVGNGILCGWHRSHIGLRQGDGGSPLVHNSKLVGIGSYWQPEDSHYDYYTNVYQFVNFIAEKAGIQIAS